MKRHDACESCGGGVRWKKTTVTLRRRGRWMIFENVPTWVCLSCGEHYYPARTLERLERIVMEGKLRGKPIRSKVVIPMVDCGKLAI